MLFRLSLVCITALSLSACSVIDPGSGISEVSELLVDRGGASISQSAAFSQNIATGGIYLKQLDKPFSLDTALRTALVYSPALHAQYARLEISRADVKQASLPRNPKLDGVITSGITGEPSRLAAGALYPVLDLVYRPIRVSESKTDFRATQVNVAEEIISHINETSDAYLQLAKSQARIRALSDVVSVARSQAKSARGLSANGGINGSEVARFENILAEAEIELNEERSAKKIVITQLASLMGTSAKQNLIATLNIKTIRQRLPSLETALSRAKKQRLDLAVAKQQVQVREVALERVGRKFGPEAVEIGVEYEREEGEKFFGPSVGIEVPIFDNGEIRFEKAQAELRLAKQEVSAINNKIETEVRTAHTDVLSKRRTTSTHRDKLVPFARAQADLAKRRFEGGQIPALDFLEAQIDATRSKLSDIDAAARYLEALGRYNTSIGSWPNIQ